MTARQLPFILNTQTKLAHRRIGLTETCNTDQITKRRNAQHVPAGYRRCELCHASYTALEALTSGGDASEPVPWREG